jgi:hypothetical protein
MKCYLIFVIIAWLTHSTYGGIFDFILGKDKIADQHHVRGNTDADTASVNGATEEKVIPPQEAKVEYTPGLDVQFWNNVTRIEFNTKEFLQFKVDQKSRLRQINFDFGESESFPGVVKDNFVAVIKGFLTSTESGVHRIDLDVDDDAQLKLGGNICYNRDLKRHKCSVIFTAGLPVSLELQYFEETGPAFCKLRWEYPKRFPMQAIPADSFSSIVSPTPPASSAARRKEVDL